MENIKFLLKFGQRKHLEQLKDGNLFFSNALILRGIEENLRIKGQGDKLEGSSKLFSNNIKMINNETGDIVAEGIKVNAIFHFEPADKIPVFCLYAVYSDECIEFDGELIIKLSENTKNTIRTHFPNANAVAIINDPEVFVDDVCNSIHSEVKADLVNYFNIANGYDMNSANHKAIDIDYMKYLMQDVPPIVEDNKKIYSFQAKYVYRSLLCKDVFFSNEQEYRILLPERQIEQGTFFNVSLSKDIKICDLDDFFNS